MNRQHTRARLGSARALLAVVLLAGVFAMHGLTGNHDVSTTMTHPAPVAAMSGHVGSGADHSAAPAHPEHVAQATEHVAPARDDLATTRMGAIAQSVSSGEPTSLPALSGQGDRHGHVHSMGDVCLAMLAALLLALIGALVRRSFTPAHPIEPPGATALVPVDGLDTRLRAPSLSKLCVLRT